MKVLSPKKVFYIGPVNLVKDLPHEFLSGKVGLVQDCEFYVGIDNLRGQEILINFALGYMMGKKRRCLIVSCRPEPEKYWEHTEPGVLLSVKPARTFQEAQNLIEEFLPKAYDSYEDYIKSPEWAEKRKIVMQMWCNRCALCNIGATPLDLHHRTYDRVGNELVTDLVPLCRNCHAKFHGKQ
jgi:hypothetical protein